MRYAYENNRILIKKQSRVCSRHLDKNGKIKLDHFSIIPSRPEIHDSTLVTLLDSFASFTNNCNIFDQFRNCDFLEEQIFIQITGWTKQQFIIFSRYVTSIRDTNGRTKEQLLAIYFYWMRKGIDQCSLAMFKNNTSQREISRYLEQIRKAINTDFVPLFLGAKSRDRNFFLSHNNIGVKTLYNMSHDDLAVIADATYTRIEKSTNNDFQYKTWSSQKNDSLMKPFLITCADGYIIDIYGPFSANLNDAAIFDYILSTDDHLLKILKPGKTVVVLDRGK